MHDSDEYISQRIAHGALVLKILQMKRPNSLFRPATEGADLGTTTSPFLRGAATTLSGILGVGASRLLERVQSYLL
jgi:hypothetical protein